jgi:hypothetical protein
MFLGQGLLWQQVWNCISTIQAQSSSAEKVAAGDGTSGETLKESTSRLKATLSNLSMGDFDPSDIGPISPLKRRRTSETEPEQRHLLQRQKFKEDVDDELPPDDLIDDLVEIYFKSIHSWIPVLHVRVSVCVRFSNDPRLSSAEVRTRYSKRSRQTVILQSMESFSVENLQALVICAFDIVSFGGPCFFSRC